MQLKQQLFVGGIVVYLDGQAIIAVDQWYHLNFFWLFSLQFYVQNFIYNAHLKTNIENDLYIQT